MKYSFSILVLTLCIVLAAAFVAGCGGGVPTERATPTTAGGTQPTEQPAPAGSSQTQATEQPAPGGGGLATEPATATAPTFTAISGNCGLLREDYQMPSTAWQTSFPSLDDVPPGFLLRAGTVACWVPSFLYTIETPEDEAFEDVLVAISSDSGYGCGLREDGSPVCWGDNSDGQASPPEGETFTAISSGYSHACGLREDGSPVCWGSNEGPTYYPNGGPASSYILDGDQAIAPEGETLIAISSGDYHTCGLRADGSAVCWGLQNPDSVPPKEETFVAISSGDYHTCGLREYGSAKCWFTDFGDYGSRQLLSEGETFTAISATCGLRENGSAVCGGDVGPPEGETFVAISATCGLREDGSVECWGDDGSVDWAIPVNSASVNP